MNDTQDVRLPRQYSLEIVIYGFAISGVCSVAQAADEQPPAPVEALGTIVVKSEKLSVENLIDRKVYTVTSDAQSSFGTLSDILSIIPSVDVDPAGIVSLRGDTKVLILIDGKPSSQFAGASAGDNLQSIPATDIERIEVLTTPPAQFKADGVAGVINIITRKGRKAGTSGSLQASGGSGRRYVLGAGGSYRSGPLAVSATAGYRQDYRQRRVESSVIAADPTSGQLIDSRNSISERIRREVPTTLRFLEAHGVKLLHYGPPVAMGVEHEVTPDGALSKEISSVDTIGCGLLEDSENGVSDAYVESERQRAWVAEF